MKQITHPNIYKYAIEDFVDWLSRNSLAIKLYFVRKFITSIDNPTDFLHLEEFTKKQFKISRRTLEKSIEKKHET